MPSNECTNTLMELSFAVGNMIGAEACDKNDYLQLQGILNAWECSRRGKTNDEYDLMKAAVSTAMKNCDAAGACLPADCENIWAQHNDLVTEMGLFEKSALKGQAGIGRELTLVDLRKASSWPTAKTTATEIVDKPTVTTTEQAATGTTGRYGKEEERWYPQRMAL